MKNQAEYAVLRFINQNSGYNIIHDYVRGSTVIQFAKKGNRVHKETVFIWLEQLATQLEHFVNSEEGQNYGEVNPYAVIVTEDNKILLLDLEADSNNDLIKKMRKKNIRSLFVAEGHVLSRNTHVEDDFYGFSQVLKFMVDCCCESEYFTRSEEKSLIHIMNLCLKQQKYEKNLWNEIKKELRKLRSRVSHCETRPKKRRMRIAFKWILLLITVCAALWLNKSIVSAWMTDVVEVGEESPDPAVIKAYREIGLCYFADLEDIDTGCYYLSRASGYDPLSKIYLDILYGIKYGTASREEGQLLQEKLKRVQKEWGNLERQNIKYEKYLYYLPVISMYEELGTQEGNIQIIHLCKDVLKNPGKSDRDEKIRMHFERACEKRTP